MYLDPGFGSMVIQILIAGVATIGASLYLFRQKIKTFFTKNSSSEEPAKEANNNIEPEEKETK